MAQLGDAVAAVDEVHGFRYFDARDLLGFVDGTENPTGQEALDATIIGAEDPGFAGGSYVIVQKYLHDLAGWNALPTETQERIIGRTKLSDVELDDAVKPTCAHNALTTIVEDGKEIKILRANMAFGQAGQSEFGTYFIGYARSPHPIEQMLITCSSAVRRATTTGYWTSAAPSPGRCFSCPRHAPGEPDTRRAGRGNCSNQRRVRGRILTIHPVGAAMVRSASAP